MTKLNVTEKAIIHDKCLEYESGIWGSVESLGDQRIKNYETGDSSDVELITPILNEIIENCEEYKEYIKSLKIKQDPELLERS